MFKTGNIFIDLAFLHFPRLHCILGFFTFREVGEGIKEVVHHDFLGGVTHELSWVLFDAVKPVVLHFQPAVDLWSFEEGQEVGTLLDVVLGDGSAVVYEHELVELCKEAAGLGSVAIEAIWWMAFEVQIAGGLHGS